MGALGGLLGTAGGAGGSGFRGPVGASLDVGVSPGQTDASYGGVQNSLASQQALLTALQGQQGINAQRNVLTSEAGLGQQQAGVGGVANQKLALTQQQNLNQGIAGNNAVNLQGNALAQQQALNQQLAGSNGVGNLSGALGSQQALAAQQQGTANQYADIAAGRGPNPALAMLNQQTGQNVANQAALMAGQRGASANVGLLARQAAQQGAATQQEAVGQGATMQANQQLAGLSGLSAQQQAIGNTNSNVANIAAQQLGAQQAGVQAQQQAAGQVIGQQQTGINAAQAAATNLTAQQMAQQQATAAQANAIAGQQIGQVNTVGQAQQNEQQQLQSALANYNQQQVGMQSNINSANAGLAQTNMQGNQGILGGVLGGLGAAIGGKAEGGEIKKTKKMADGGDPGQVLSSVPAMAPTPPPVAPPPVGQGPQSSFGKFLTGFGQNTNGNPGGKSNANPLQSGLTALGKGIGERLRMPSADGQSPPAETNISDFNDIGKLSDTLAAAKGGLAKSPGNRVKALLSEGEVDVPKKIVDSTDPLKNASDFVRKSLSSSGGGLVKAKNEEERAVKAGNSYDNDKIAKNVPIGDVIIPRNVMQSGDPARGAADFVAKVLAKKRSKGRAA